MKKQECSGQRAEMRGEYKAFKKLPVVKWDEGLRAAELMLNKYLMKG